VLSEEDSHARDMGCLIRINNDRKRPNESPIRDSPMRFTKLLPYHHRLHYRPCVLAHPHNLFRVYHSEHHRLIVLSRILS